MEMITYHDQVGTQWKEIIGKSFMRLSELKTEYEKKGAKAWMNLYDISDGKWMLTVRENDSHHTDAVMEFARGF